LFGIITLLVDKLCKFEEDFCFFLGVLSLNTFINILVIDFSAIFYFIVLKDWELFNDFIYDWDQFLVVYGKLKFFSDIITDWDSLLLSWIMVIFYCYGLIWSVLLIIMLWLYSCNLSWSTSWSPDGFYSMFDCSSSFFYLIYVFYLCGADMLLIPVILPISFFVSLNASVFCNLD
jgi:hypothetical protein